MTTFPKLRVGTRYIRFRNARNAVVWRKVSATECALTGGTEKFREDRDVAVYPVYSR